jgi:hypothetical protein
MRHELLVEEKRDPLRIAGEQSRRECYGVTNGQAVGRRIKSDV